MELYILHELLPHCSLSLAKKKKKEFHLVALHICLSTEIGTSAGTVSFFSMPHAFIFQKTPRSTGLYCSDPLYNPLCTTELCQCPCELIGYPRVSIQAARKKRVN